MFGTLGGLQSDAAIQLGLCERVSVWIRREQSFIVNDRPHLATEPSLS